MIVVVVVVVREGTSGHHDSWASPLQSVGVGSISSPLAGFHHIYSSALTALTVSILPGRRSPGGGKMTSHTRLYR